MKKKNCINKEQESELYVHRSKNLLAKMQPWSLPFALVQKFVATVTKTLVPLVDSNEITISKERQEILMHPILRNAYVIEE